MRVRALWLVVVLGLAGCSGIDLPSPPPPPPPPPVPPLPALPSIGGEPAPPPYRRIIAPRLRSILGDPAKAGILQISGLRRVNYIRGPSWIACIKVSSFTIPRYYAVFIQGEQIVDSRFAILLDLCEMQTYEPFDWVSEVGGDGPAPAGALPPPPVAPEHRRR